ncbi:MAG: chemotaxis protein CheC [Magnetococcales bacterium]|nr:chemotaxis protein CheC [Magnetococcales bacterium]
MNLLSDLEQDALLEMLNIGMGRAAAALSQMVQDEVFLSVPQVVLLDRRQTLELIRQHAADRVCAIRQAFGGPFQGSALLIYPEEASLELVRALLREEVPLQTLTELEQESLVEVGNVILNACIGTIANLLQTEFQCALPIYLHGSCEQLLGPEPAPSRPDGGNHLLLFVDFVTGGNRIRGNVVLILDMSAIAQLKDELHHTLQRLPD